MACAKRIVRTVPRKCVVLSLVRCYSGGLSQAQRYTSVSPSRCKSRVAVCRSALGQQHRALLQPAADARLGAATLGVVVEHVLGCGATGTWSLGCGSARGMAWQRLPRALRCFLALKRVMCKYSPGVRHPALHDPTATASVPILALVL